MRFTQKVAFDLENQFLLKIHLIFYVKRFLIIDWFNKSIEMCEKRGVTTVREGNEEGERIALRGKKLEKIRERDRERDLYHLVRSTYGGYHSGVTTDASTDTLRAPVRLDNRLPFIHFSLDCD